MPTIDIYSMNPKQISIILGIIVILLLIIVGYLAIGKSSPLSYEECVKAGGEVTNVSFIRLAGSPAPDYDSICRYKSRTFQNSTSVKNDPSNLNSVQMPSPQTTSTPSSPASLKRVCPDAWYDNQMPGIVGQQSQPNQYLIVNGQRAELSDYDMEWIKNNCPVNKPTVIY